ncbi:MAG: CRISPR system precrRNA processing endoribonuclease RAMP protein Cas6 [Nitrososphaerota archaeon]|nr:CRISPR system precrRNA processing endoribonuclease RAMP protein Cas6 [Nitrososphaerota archaeon]
MEITDLKSRFRKVDGGSSEIQLSRALSYASRLRILDLGFEIEFLSDVVLPTYKGSTLHGGLGRAFRQLYCTCAEMSRTPDENDSEGQYVHHEAEACPYHFIFETRINDDAFRFLRNVPSVPHPYLLDPPLDEKKEYIAGERLAFTLRLFGSATGYAVNMIEAVALFGRLGVTRASVHFRIVRVTSKGAGWKQNVIYDGASNTYLAIPKPYRWKPGKDNTLSHEVMIRFLSPTRLVKTEHLQENVDFLIIFTSLIRRLAALAYYAEGLKNAVKLTEGVNISVNSVRLVKQDIDWKAWRRYSNRQSTAMLLGGVVGELTFGNVTEDLLLLLEFGKLLHLGKQTTFGLGKYEIVPK